MDGNVCKAGISGSWMGKGLIVPVERVGPQDSRRGEILRWTKCQHFRLERRNDAISNCHFLSVYMVPDIRLSAPQALCAVILTITHETGMIMTHILQRKEMKLIQIQYPTTG